MMNKIEELIEKLCPNGVEFKKLGDISYIKTGKGLTKKDCVENGNYAIISGGIMPLGYCNIKNREKNTVTIARAGTAGYVNYIEKDFYLNDKCFSVIPNEKYNKIINSKFLYYYLKNIEQDIMGLKSEGSVPTVNTEKISKICIPVPPLEVQHEIVNILDDFTELTGELTGELATELTARRNQYEYYKAKILSNVKGKNVTINEISNSIKSGRNKIRSENGKYPVYGSTGIIGKTDNYEYTKEMLLIARVGANAGFVHIAKGEYDVSDNTIIVDLIEQVNKKYIFYYLENFNLNKIARGAGQPLITATQIKELEIKLPSLDEQDRIVSILDRFDKLCNDISEGLLAEIEARQKQYEYYRDKLLTFKELKTDESI